MHRKITVETLEREAESLPSQEQLKLVEILIHKLRNTRMQLNPTLRTRSNSLYIK
jgi:hypothetical protein